MIELIVLTVLGSLFITFEKPVYVIALMASLQLFALFPNSFAVDLNYYYLLVFTLLPAFLITLSKRTKQSSRKPAKVIDFVIYTALVVIISTIYMIASTDQTQNFSTVELQRSVASEVWAIALILFIFTMGILSRLRKK